MGPNLRHCGVFQRQKHHVVETIQAHSQKSFDSRYAYENLVFLHQGQEWSNHAAVNKHSHSHMQGELNGDFCKTVTSNLCSKRSSFFGNLQWSASLVLHAKQWMGQYVTASKQTFHLMTISNHNLSTTPREKNIFQVNPSTSFINGKHSITIPFGLSAPMKIKRHRNATIFPHCWQRLSKSSWYSLWVYLPSYKLASKAANMPK